MENIEPIKHFPACYLAMQKDERLATFLEKFTDKINEELKTLYSSKI